MPRIYTEIAMDQSVVGSSWIEQHSNVKYLCFGCQQSETEDSFAFWRQKHECPRRTKIEKHETQTHSDSSNQTTNSFHRGYCSGCPGCCILIPSAWLLILLLEREAVEVRGGAEAKNRFPPKIRQIEVPQACLAAPHFKPRTSTGLTDEILMS